MGRRAGGGGLLGGSSGGQGHPTPCSGPIRSVSLAQGARKRKGGGEDGGGAKDGNVFVDMVRVPDWAFEAAGQELRGMGQDTAYHPGLYLTATQREAVEALIQELPKFRLKAVPTDCSECPICLEEFRVGNEVRGLPCAHNFHVECIDQWLRLNVKCPRCRCSVFPNLDLSALSNIRADSGRTSASEVTTATRYVRSQPAGQSYLLRLQGLLWPIRTENAGTIDDGGLAAGENGVHAADLSSPSANPTDPVLSVVIRRISKVPLNTFRNTI
ncbi:hypothetical protein Taro_014249 [Colocasia esculenta]|uniref:RING-type domain-containing protein n=1 Tax=Colocasia esculenta TaxID=4460 RepID=A0A843UHS2_COLES|nr:hypothetical protein [Colocasia esculenta]